jgi:hypothetical protein
LVGLCVVEEYPGMNKGIDSLRFLMRQYLLIKIMFQQKTEKSSMTASTITIEQTGSLSNSEDLDMIIIFPSNQIDKC